MKALLFEGPQKVALREVPAPETGDDEALVAIDACGVCGTDLAKVYQADLKPPVPLGHEVAGRIERLGRKVKGFREGDRVVVAHHVPCGDCHYCLRGHPSMCRQFKATNLDPGGFSQYVRVPALHVKQVMLKVPKGLDAARASQTEPLACCLRNVRRLGLREGDLAVVVGLGTIGLMTAQLLKHLGIGVAGFDLDPLRVRLAQKAGLSHAYTGKDGRGEEIVRSLTGGRGADALILTIGAPGLIHERLSWIRDGGTLNVFAGFHEQRKVLVDLDQVYRRELSIVSSYSPAPEDLAKALELIASEALDLEPHIRSTFTLEQFPEAVRQLKGREILKAILIPQRK